MRRRFTIHIPGDAHAAVRRLAAAESRSQSRMAEVLLLEALKRRMGTVPDERDDAPQD